MKQLLVLIAALAMAVSAVSAFDAVVNLRCEHQVEPLGVEAEGPRLSWQLQSQKRGIRQVGYHILVASSPGLLQEDKGDLWDSGRVASAKSNLVPYQGKALTAHQQCYHG